MRIIVMSDTHGQLSHVNNLARKHEADSVIHCGDFGFMTHATVDAYPNRELSLNIKHSPDLPMELRKQAWDLSREEKIEIIEDHKLLGEFDHYLAGTESFDVPLYAIWGNHEDIRVIRSLLSGDMEVENLNLVTSNRVHRLGDIMLTGIGGNMSVKQFFAKPHSGSFYPYMTFQEWAEVRYSIKKAKTKGTDLWFQTHVSPGKHPMLEQFGLHLNVDVWFSGHMGVPFPQHYSLFTNFNDHQFVERVEEDLRFTIPLWEEFKEKMQLWIDLTGYIDEHMHLDNYPTIVNGFVEQHSPDPDMLGLMRSDAGKYYRSKLNNHDFNHDYLDYGQFQFLKAAEVLFKTPVDKIKEIKTLKDYTSRKPANWVRKGWYFNLPDVYDGGYVVIDTNQGNGYTVQSFGHLR